MYREASFRATKSAPLQGPVLVDVGRDMPKVPDATSSFGGHGYRFEYKYIWRYRNVSFMAGMTERAARIISII